MVTAILALQGAFEEHGKMLDRLHADHFEIRQKKDLERPFDALILPGGESTVMGKLLRELELLEPLRAKITSGMPVFGTCAGLILLAKEVEGEDPCIQTMDIRVKRNAYGRQLGSFYTEADFTGIGNIPMTFIRAPYISEVIGAAKQPDTRKEPADSKTDETVQILAEVDGRIIAARQGNQLVTAFHPELNEDTRVHQYFLKMSEEAVR